MESLRPPTLVAKIDPKCLFPHRVSIPAPTALLGSLQRCGDNRPSPSHAEPRFAARRRRRRRSAPLCFALLRWRYHNARFSVALAAWRHGAILQSRMTIVVMKKIPFYAGHGRVLHVRVPVKQRSQGVLTGKSSRTATRSTYQTTILNDVRRAQKSGLGESIQGLLKSIQLPIAVKSSVVQLAQRAGRDV
ncbi:hypothetical protein NEUTE1DRAFT_115139 [Neurospora tetrasperma FGSC 2508]|uniref:Uncharacterized protein n=1 Tax=Neurospora tetrasperma (strain FGSC 2508 / ATCC MYA-4615 / P0657) TaxID=510951 RepID=F8N2D0_NEUT8|nr:uncharacterized protein NEUTE1DRAFT_115139 [Neurospora tetrasperma FGSC 2508]EGO53301.1 hypothetical protein NEUTE1DRAFT_115139 [Neurospora tetrasperma FGSC 2508]